MPRIGRSRCRRTERIVRWPVRIRATTHLNRFWGVSYVNAAGHPVPTCTVLSGWCWSNFWKERFRARPSASRRRSSARIHPATRAAITRR